MLTTAVIGMLKAGGITLITSTLMKKAGNLELSQIMKLGGWSIIGIYLVDFIANVWSNPPTIVLGFQKVMELLSWILKNGA